MEKFMKQKPVIALLAVLLALSVAACGAKDPEPPVSVRVAALKGPTAMGLVKLMRDAREGAAALDYDFTLGVIDEIVPKISAGDLDIAALPANLASVLYNNTDGAVQVAAINTLGVLYVLEKGETLHSAVDLAGRTILSTGKGATPEYSLNYVLERNGIDPQNGVTVEYRSEAAEVTALLKQDQYSIALLPQPFVVGALRNVDGLRIALDWTEEWERVSGNGSMPVTGVFAVRREFAESRPEVLQTFLSEYAASAAFVNENTEEAAVLIGEYGIADADVAREALSYCSITYINGEKMKEMLSAYLAALYGQNPQSVGGGLPDDAFYIAP
jgi:NitT/TauT family transport system substrate-binding protein